MNKIKNDLRPIMPYLIIILTILCICDLRKLVENLMIGFIVLVYILLILMVIWLAKVCIDDVRDDYVKKNLSIRKDKLNGKNMGKQ